MAKTKKKFRQVAALPYRINGAGCEVVLVTTRESGRWILPKGWPIKGMRPFEAAATEALEEAGLVGRADRVAIGQFTYVKRFTKRSEKVLVDVFPLEVNKQRETWLEKDQREVRWFPAEEASATVSDAGVGGLIRRFAEGLGKTAANDRAAPETTTPPAK